MNSNLFPLTVVQDEISIEESERTELVSEISKMKNTNKGQKNTSYAWTGDTKGFQFLFSNKKFNSLSSKFLPHL